ncbi:MAG: hypothetical protein ABIP71_12720, partial [Verrucomicrobiota bacterium]
MILGWIQFDWSRATDKSFLAKGLIRCTGADELTWELTLADGKKEVGRSRHHRNSIREMLARWIERFPVINQFISVLRVKPQEGKSKPLHFIEPPFAPHESPWQWFEDEIVSMANSLGLAFSPLGEIGTDAFFEKETRCLDKKLKQQEELQSRIRANQKRIEEQQRHRDEERRARIATQKKLEQTKSAPAVAPVAPPKPPLTVPLRVELSPLEFQDTLLPLTELRSYFLRERAALWWVSNQSDDLLALPYCRIEHLEYQIRTALRIIGPLRGRALLSDEVGLGKTIEAGLVIKEYLTRGMATRILVLTVPSLVDQWEEELAD